MMPLDVEREQSHDAVGRGQGAISLCRWTWTGSNLIIPLDVDLAGSNLMMPLDVDWAGSNFMMPLDLDREQSHDAIGPACTKFSTAEHTMVRVS